jgi:hypothetical protein
VGCFDPGLFDAAGYHGAHVRVFGDFPGHGNLACRHAAQAVFGEGIQRQPGPDDETVCPRLARSDAKHKRIGAEAGVVRD